MANGNQTLQQEIQQSQRDRQSLINRQNQATDPLEQQARASLDQAAQANNLSQAAGIPGGISGTAPTQNISGQLSDIGQQFGLGAPPPTSQVTTPSVGIPTQRIREAQEQLAQVGQGLRQPSQFGGALTAASQRQLSEALATTSGDVAAQLAEEDAIRGQAAAGERLQDILGQQGQAAGTRGLLTRAQFEVGSQEAIQRQRREGQIAAERERREAIGQAIQVGTGVLAQETARALGAAEIALGGLSEIGKLAIQEGQLNIQGAELLQNAEQFNARQQFEAWATQQGIASDQVDRVWQFKRDEENRQWTSAENELDRQLQSDIEEGRISLADRELVERRRQFDETLTFKERQHADQLIDNAENRRLTALLEGNRLAFENRGIAFETFLSVAEDMPPEFAAALVGQFASQPLFNPVTGEINQLQLPSRAGEEDWKQAIQQAGGDPSDEGTRQRAAEILRQNGQYVPNELFEGTIVQDEQGNITVTPGAGGVPDFSEGGSFTGTGGIEEANAFDDAVLSTPGAADLDTRQLGRLRTLSQNTGMNSQESVDFIASLSDKERKTFFETGSPGRSKIEDMWEGGQIPLGQALAILKNASGKQGEQIPKFLKRITDGRGKNATAEEVFIALRDAGFNAEPGFGRDSIAAATTGVPSELFQEIGDKIKEIFPELRGET